MTEQELIMAASQQIAQAPDQRAAAVAMIKSINPAMVVSDAMSDGAVKLLAVELYRQKGLDGFVSLSIARAKVEEALALAVRMNVPETDIIANLAEGYSKITIQKVLNPTDRPEEKPLSKRQTAYKIIAENPNMSNSDLVRVLMKDLDLQIGTARIYVYGARKKEQAE